MTDSQREHDRALEEEYNQAMEEQYEEHMRVEALENFAKAAIGFIEFEYYEFEPEHVGENKEMNEREKDQSHSGT